MAFAFEMAYVGPYALTLAKAQAGDTQSFHFKVPASKDELDSAAFMLSGQIRKHWSTASDEGPVLGAGEVLNGERTNKEPAPLCLNESLTLTALTDSTYISAGVVGIEQKAVVTRVSLQAAERLSLPRYNLIIVPAGAALSVNDAPAAEGPRLIYARSGEVVVEARGACHLGVLSLQG